MIVRSAASVWLVVTNACFWDDDPEESMDQTSTRPSGLDWTCTLSDQGGRRASASSEDTNDWAFDPRIAIDDFGAMTAAQVPFESCPRGKISGQPGGSDVVAAELVASSLTIQERPSPPRDHPSGDHSTLSARKNSSPPIPDRTRRMGGAPLSCRV